MGGGVRRSSLPARCRAALNSSRVDGRWAAMRRMTCSSMDIMQHNQEVYNKIARHFSATRSWVWDDLVPLKQYVKKGDQVLDLACGNGRLYLLLRDLSISYLGVDYSEELLEQAREKFPRLEFKYGELTNIPAKDQEFDVVFCLAAFHHLPDRKTRLKSLQEMKRALKPNGRLIMTNWNIYSDWGKKKLETGNWKLGKNSKEISVPWKNQEGVIVGERIYYSYTPEELEKMMVETGLAVEKQYYAVKKGSGDAGEGQNMVTVARKH